MCEERYHRTWEAQLVPEGGVGEADQKTGAPKTNWESDRLIVLRERGSRSQGEGADVDTKPAKETLTGHEGPDTSANLTVGDSEQGS